MPEITSTITCQRLRSSNMERDGNQIAHTRLQSTNTMGQGASQGYYIVALHTFILALIAILGFCIQLKFPNVSPYATAYGTRLMNVFTIETSIYIVSLIVMTNLASRNNADSEDLMNKVSLLLGTLPLNLELLVLLKSFGWFVLSIWIICLVCFVCKYYQSLQTLCNTAVEHLVHVLGEFRKKLTDWKSNRMIRNDRAVNMGISNGERATELQPQNVNNRSDRRAMEHQSQDQNHTSVIQHAISIPVET